MSVNVLKAGILDSLQDLGRSGYANLGINKNGVMDSYAAQAANLLVGNHPGEVVIEMHFPALQLFFEQTSFISICGADFTPYLDDQPLPLWQPIVVRKNTALHFDKLQKGGRCYLAVHGGFSADHWLGSGSTHLKAGVGGHGGRRLEKGDQVLIGESHLYFAAWLKEDCDFTVFHWGAGHSNVYRFANEVAVIPGHEWDCLSQVSKRDFLENGFIIHPFSDRMGYQLKGISLSLNESLELVSAAVSFGTIQLLPNGQLVVLMADHQTTGGYPRIAHVVSAHLPKLAQLRPSDTIQFRMIDNRAAEELLFSQQRDLIILQRSCLDHLNQLVCQA